MAALDELSAHLGIITEHEDIQKTISSLMSLISTTSHTKRTGISFKDFFVEETRGLEEKIDKLSTMLPNISGFVTYGNCPESAQLDLTRAVARRAETLLSLVDSDYAFAAFPYINRLSDYLYIKARYADFENLITKSIQETLTSKKEMTLTQAKAILAKIEKQAIEINLPVTITITNAAGLPIAVHVMDGALLVGYEAAIAKAYTAAAVKMPTIELNNIVQPGQPFYGLESIKNILPIGGGVPLFDEYDRLLGAIGVSGGTAQQDHDLAMIGRSG